MNNYKRYFFMSIILISLGIVFSTSLGNTFGSLGTVFVAVGGLLFVVAMGKKRRSK